MTGVQTCALPISVKGVARLAGLAVEGAARSTVLVNRTVPTYLERRLVSNIGLTDKGIEIFDKPKESIAKSIFTSWGQWAVAFGTEFAGEILFPSMVKGAKNFIPKRALRFLRDRKSVV